MAIDMSERAVSALQAALQKGIEAAHIKNEPMLVGNVFAVSNSANLIQMFATESAVNAYKTRLFFHNGKTGVTRLGFGAAVEQEFHGADAVRQLKQSWRDVSTSLRLDDGVHAQFFAGFPFALGQKRQDPWNAWPDGWLVLPEIVLEQSESGTWLTWYTLVSDGMNAQQMASALWSRANILLQQSTVPANMSGETRVDRSDQKQTVLSTHLAMSREQWEDVLSGAISDIKRGEFHKVVLSRREDYQCSERVDLAAALSALQRDYADSTVFAIVRDGSTFLGATPEHLVAVQGDAAFIDCLAGTAPRGEGLDDDNALGTRLLASEKDLEEHRYVLHGIFDDIADVALDINAPQSPILRRLKNVQHLYTPVTVDLKDHASILDLVMRLHPTPAVCGLPREAAKSAITAREAGDRGYYAGPIGWFDEGGNGTFAVALRCALIRDNTAYLYAGVGIVGTSDPAAEFTETQWKLQPMKRALNL